MNNNDSSQQTYLSCLLSQTSFISFKLLTFSFGWLNTISFWCLASLTIIDATFDFITSMILFLINCRNTTISSILRVSPHFVVLPAYLRCRAKVPCVVVILISAGMSFRNILVVPCFFLESCEVLFFTGLYFFSFFLDFCYTQTEGITKKEEKETH